MSNIKLICQICGKVFQRSNIIACHIVRNHKISLKDYYDKYFKLKNEDICIVCGQETKFKNITNGYYKHCCKDCIYKDEDVNLRKKETKIKKYGEDFQKIFNKKGIETKLQKYGDRNYNNLIVAKQTKLEKYGDRNYNNTDRRKQTCQEKYGVDNPQKNKSIRIKTIETLKKNNRIKREKQKDEIKSFKQYSKLVRQETEQWRKILFENWNGKCYYSNIDLIYDKSDYNNPLYPVIDHVISIDFGFKNKIDYKIIGNVKNLVICSRLCNGQKWVNPVEEYLNRSL